MSLRHLRAHSAAQADPAFSGSAAPGIPDSAFVYPAPGDNDDSLPLPDHFPEPYTDPHPPAADRAASRSSITLETGQTLVYCSTERVVNKPVYSKSRAGDVRNGVDGVPDEAKEGVRRITDKYAAPGSLLRNASVSSPSSSGAWAGYDPDVLNSRDTLPSAPTPSITLPSPSSPSPSAATYNPLTVMMNGGHSSGAGSSSRSSSSAASPTESGALPNPSVAVAARQYGGGGVLQHDKLTPLSVPAFSDASSDLSDASPSPVMRTDEVHCGSSSASVVGAGRYQSISGVSFTSLGEGVTEQDLQQVEMFYKSHKSDVVVCHSLANLYIGSATATTSPTTPGAVPNSSATSDSWEFVTTGIPLLVLDTGDHHRPRQLSIVVAEKGTAFVLWKDVVSHLTRYACLHANFHTLRLSSDHNKLAGLSFDDSQAAAEFAASVLQLTSDPDDDLLMLSKNNKKKSRKQKQQESKKKPKYKPPKKTDISQPCCFQHVTKLEPPQMGGCVPLPPNTFPPAPGGSVSSMSDVFHERLSLSMSRARSRSSELSEASTAPSDH